MFKHTHMMVCQMIVMSCVEGIFYVRELTSSVGLGNFQGYFLLVWDFVKPTKEYNFYLLHLRP